MNVLNRQRVVSHLVSQVPSGKFCPHPVGLSMSVAGELFCMLLEMVAGLQSLSSWCACCHDVV